MRRLLPYEHQLIQALKVTKEEYLEFLAAQYDFTQSPEERSSTLRAEPASTIALVLTVVGTLFQVAAALLAKPAEAQRQRRPERFSPRFGFNSAQELAQYGDPINLVYSSTEDNELGGVRVATSLVWSAIESYGSSQFMQVLLVLGAAKIRELDPERFAFGQLSLRQILSSKVWVYFDRSGRVVYDDKVLGDGRDPSRPSGAPGGDDVCRITDGNERRSGFSQAFSPTSMNLWGVYSPIPINVDIQERDSEGQLRTAWNGIKIRGDQWQAINGRWREGDTFSVVFTKTDKSKREKIAEETANDLRYQYVESLDPAATYMLGTALFRLKDITEAIDLDKADVVAEFECLEGGRTPFTSYNAVKAYSYDQSQRDAIENAANILKNKFEEESSTGAGVLATANTDALERSQRYYDSDDDRYSNLQRSNVKIDFLGIRYDFSGDEKVTWNTDIQSKTEDFKQGSYTVDRAGSIAYTKKELERFLADKPKLSTKKLRESYETDLEQLRELRDYINGADESITKELRQEAKKSGIIQDIKDEIDTLQDKVDKQIGERYGYKKNANNDGLLKEKGTDLTTDDSKKVDKLLKDIDKLREDKADLLSDDISRQRKVWIDLIRNSNDPFTAFGNSFSGGIRYVKRQLGDLKGEETTDQRGVSAVRDYFRELIRGKEEALKFTKYVSNNWEEIQSAADDHFYTKCLVKVEEAVYQTVSSCDYVKLAIKSRVFRTISGRAKQYGENDAPNGFKQSDNGFNARLALYKLFYKRTSDPVTQWQQVPTIFAVRRGADQDSFIGLNFRAASPDKWEFKLRGISDMASEIRASAPQNFAYIKNSGSRSLITHQGNEFRFTGSLVPIDPVLLRPDREEQGPVMTNEWDLFSTRSDSQLQGSFDSGPEFTLSAVTEQQRSGIDDKYKDISMMALSVLSGLGMQDLRSISAFVTEGKECYRLDDQTGVPSKGTRSSSWAPDIFADTVLDPENGIGSYAQYESIDWDQLFRTKQFCRNNGLGTPLHMDGVVAEIGNWRQFWVDTAPYSLLEFAQINGRETLIPAIPTTPDGRATREITAPVLFNQGNILENTYREEFIDYGSDVQDLIATGIYRETEFKDVFPRNASVTVSRADVVESLAIRQTFDLSQFVTRREQVILYLKLLCNQRRLSRRSIEFQTIPTDSPVAPGSFIAVDIGINIWDSLTTGIVTPGGGMNSPLQSFVVPGTYTVLLYQSGQPTITLNNVVVDATTGQAPQLAPYAGRLFVLGNTIGTERIFRVSEVELAEEGEVTVRGTEYPCDRDGNRLFSRIADFSDNLFQIT